MSSQPAREALREALSCVGVDVRITSGPRVVAFVGDLGTIEARLTIGEGRPFWMVLPSGGGVSTYRYDDLRAAIVSLVPAALRGKRARGQMSLDLGRVAE